MFRNIGREIYVPSLTADRSGLPSALAPQSRVLAIVVDIHHLPADADLPLDSISVAVSYHGGDLWLR